MGILQNNLIDWGDKVVNNYIDLVNKGNDFAFYTQSDLTKLFGVCPGNVDVMILGINPGSEGSYTAQKQSPRWHLNGGNMTGKTFLKGNYSSDKNGKFAWENREQWLYWKRLKRFFSKCDSNPLEDETKFVLTNVCHFNTPKANQISGQLLYATKWATVELIDMINPKRLVFLSGKNALQRLNLQKDFQLLKCNVYVGTYSGIPCLGIPHPSAYLSQSERDYISETIASFMNEGADLNILSKIEQPIAMIKVSKRIARSERIADAKRVLRSFSSTDLACSTGRKGTGLRKDRDYISFCNDAFELYSAETLQEHIQLFVKDTRLIERLADFDIEASIDENDKRGYKISWPFRDDLYSVGYVSIIKDTISKLVKLYNDIG